MRRALFVPSILTAVVLAGCGGEDVDASARADAPAGTSVPSSAPTTSEWADPVDIVDEPSGSPTPAREATPTVTEQPTLWPDEVAPVHGGPVWAVYLAVGSPDSTAETHVLEETDSHLRGLGYAGSAIGSVGCDQGAAEALGLDPGHNRVAVYFDSAARAQQFVAAYDRQDLGSAQVTTYCLD